MSEPGTRWRRWRGWRGVWGAVRGRVLAPFRAFLGQPHRWEGGRAGSDGRRAGAAAAAGLNAGRERAWEIGADGGEEHEAARVEGLMRGALVPMGLPADERFEVAAATLAAREVSGDYFDCFMTPEGRVVVAIADASGKGVPAAMFASAIRAIVRESAMAGLSPGAVLERANRVLTESNPEAMFVTALLVLYDAGTGAMVAANAGHPGAVIVGRDGTAREALVVGGTVLGAVGDAGVREGRLSLGPGESLVMMSDGVTEAHVKGGELFGRERIAEVCTAVARGGWGSGGSGGSGGGSVAEDLSVAVLEAAVRWEAGRLHDDATVVVLRRKAQPRGVG